MSRCRFEYQGGQEAPGTILLHALPAPGYALLLIHPRQHHADRQLGIVGQRQAVFAAVQAAGAPLPVSEYIASDADFLAAAEAWQSRGIAEHEGEHLRALGERVRINLSIRRGRAALARAYARDGLAPWFGLHMATIATTLAADLDAGFNYLREPDAQLLVEWLRAPYSA